MTISKSISTAPPRTSSASHSGGQSSTESPSVSASPVTVICSVLCLHDFTSDEEHGLSFRRNEILEVVQKEDTGWWAAMRRKGTIVGWIPEAFVTPLTPAMAEHLREIREELRVYEYQAEQLYNAVPPSKPSLQDPDLHPLPTTIGQRPSSPKHLSRTRSRDALSGRSQGEVDRLLLKAPPRAYSRSKKLPPPPPSPTTPMPHPPAQSAPLYYNKPVPPLPQELFEIRTRSASLSSRSLRRRPLMVDDNTALSRLSTLIETKNTREIDMLANPDVTGSFQALAKRSQAARQRRQNEGRQRLLASFQISEKAWYILPAHADELELDALGKVQSGSLLGLVERLTSDIVFAGPDQLDPFAHIFLMTFRTFTTSEELFDLLLDRFSMTRPDNLNEIEVADWKRRSLVPTQRHVLDVFTLWLENHRLLEDDPHIAQRLPDFIRHVATPRLPTEGQTLLQNIERLTFADPIRPSMGIMPKKPLKTKDHKNDILRIEPSVLADQLTLYEYHLYDKITPRECLAYIRKQSGPDVENLAAFCSTYDKLGTWVKSSILNTQTLTKRAQVIDYWIKVAERCRANSNYASMSSIISAVSSVVITRLTFTWTHTGRKAQLDALLKHNEPSGGFAGYRSLLRHVEDVTTCVPFITMYLSDLIRIREQYRDEEKTISFIQRQRWHDTINSILKFQHRPPQHIYDEYINTFIRDRLQEAVLSPDDTWFWDRSQEIVRVEYANADVRKGLEQVGF
ncbi:ras guanine nucleotide exchange factor domain-containing protein [Ephemerocybe angulata]|uniref:Ras guanine nucleotide exchange factor domain-containing protein n=1 Tax=Ephemerocybe angulata TaxID=980116 RepID=A0A8H6M7P4_9AGAR|nr:ras guanine nucleotide exchange factor domain-containing protein [Tulosesus angulatus]